MRFGLSKLNQPRFIYNAGIYNDTLTNVHGCDSIIVLRLNVYPRHFNDSIRHIADIDTPYVWIHRQGGKEIARDSLYNAGDYEYIYKSQFGCDSIDSLHLFIHQTYQIYDDTITICRKETPYTWRGLENITTSGDYKWGAQTADGYDSIHYVYIRVLEPILDTVRHEMCEGSTFEFKNMKLTEAGIYRDTLVRQNGCDSIVTLILTVNKPYYHVIRETILEGQYYVFFGDTIRKTGNAIYTSRTPQGCDSTTILELTVHPLIDTVVTMCYNDLPYIWTKKNGQTVALYKEGTYRNDTTINGEHYFYGLQLVVNNTSFDTIRHTMCEGDYYTFKGQQITTAGIYRDTLTDSNGCDSILTLIVTVTKPYYDYRIEHIIEGDSVWFYGDWKKTTDVYTYHGQKIGGCDSTSVLQLIVHPMVDTVVTVCSSNLPYAWVNKWTGKTTLLYSAGIYRNDTTYVNGEKMFYGLQLIVRQPSDTTIYREICEGSSYRFNNRDLTVSGEYRDTISNTIGCDSMIILHLNVLKKYYNIVERTIYEGDTVHFEDSVFSEPGRYPFRYQNSYGCDSIIELQLSVVRLFDDSVSICQNELPYVWHNKTIYESGIYRDTVVNSEGKPTTTGIKVIVLPILKASEPVVATICEGDYYKFGNRVLTEQGTYYDTLTAVTGCDSIVMLALQVMPAKYQTTTKRIFEGDTVFFYGDTLTTSGIYEHREINENKCTDTYQLVLTVLKTFNVDTTAVICSNELPFIWHGIEYSKSGDYTMPISWNDSSRLVKTLHLTVNETFYGERNVALCQGSTFIYKKKEYTQSGFFYDTIPALTGCDSIIKYIISVHPSYDRIDTVHISDKQQYNFHGRDLNQSGYYEYTQPTQYGCDSVHHLYLVVHPSYFFTDTIDLCKPDSIIWRGETIKQSGVYTDSLLTDFYNFDSVYQVVVNVHPSYIINEQYEIGEGEILKIHGKDISSPDIYYDTMRTVYGCDSIYHIVVNKKRTREFTWTKSICQGDVFEFYGKLLTKTGQYTYTSPHKDSVVTLILTVNPVTYSEQRIVITDKSTSYTGADGNTYYTYIHDGILYDSLKLGNNLFTENNVNQYGCDSISRLIIIVSSHYSEWDQIPLCEGDSIKMDGQVITESGLYTFLRRSKVTGEMDSIYRVEVYDAPKFEYDIARTICDGDTIFFKDKAVTRAGHYDIVLKTTEGCDSIYHLDLTVNPSYRFYTDATIPDYQTYTWRDKTYDSTGIYDRTWPTIHDCDSTYTLRLNVIPTQRNRTVDTICDGQTYTWRGKTYTMDGYYTDTVYRPETNYSAIYTLELKVLSPTNITSATASEVCADDTELEIKFTYSGATPTTYSIFFNQAAKEEGFVDVVNKQLYGEDKVVTAPIPTKGGDLYNGHPNYVRPNRYPVRLVFGNGSCGMSSKDSIIVLVKYPSWIIEQNWDDVVAPLKKTYNGGYEFSRIDWYVVSSGYGPQMQPNNGLGYLHNDKLKPGDEVYMLATRKGENYAIPSCPIEIQPLSTTVDNDPIIVRPKVASHRAPRITIEAPQEGKYAIYSSMGTYISGGKLEEGIQQVVLPSTSGIYFIRTTQDKEETTHKIVLY